MNCSRLLAACLLGCSVTTNHAQQKRPRSSGCPITWLEADLEYGTVPFAQGEAMAATLEKAGAKVTFVRVEGGGHGLGGREINQRRLNFFERHLRGQEVEVPATPIQVETPKN